MLSVPTYASADTNNSIDLDIEGGSSTGFVALVNRLRTKFNGASKKYYVTAVRMFCSLLLIVTHVRTRHLNAPSRMPTSALF
jgi:hypothetical protein